MDSLALNPPYNTAYLTYPSHYVNRFVHSLGTMELAGKMAFYALEKSAPETVEKFLKECAESFSIDLKEIKKFFIQIVRLSGLLHDLGHPPFSHLGEKALSEDDILKLYDTDDDFKKFVSDSGGKMPKYHEFTTYCLIRDNQELGPLLTEHYDYKSPLLKTFGSNPKGIFATIKEIISSDIDADRADFLLRDGMTSGIGFGQYDTMRLVESMVIYFDNRNELFRIVPTTAALSTVEAFLVERYKLYKWLYYHPHIVLTDTALSHLIRKLLEWSKTPEHPLGNLLNPGDFHYSKYIWNELPFDDTVVMQKLKDAFCVCKKLLNCGNTFQDDIDLAHALLRIVLFREKFGKAVFKNISQYISFDLELKKHMKDADTPYRDILTVTDEPLLNKYAGLIAGTMPLQEDHRFDKILASDDQFVLETERAGFEPYSFGRYESRHPIAGHEQLAVVKKEYRSKFFLIDKKSGEKLFISELSQTVKQLLESWRNDMQLFLYIVRLKRPNKEEWPNIIEESKSKIKEHIIFLWKNDMLRKKQIID